MKSIFIAILATFFLFGCATTRKVEKTEKSIKTEKITSEVMVDSSRVTLVTDPTESEIVFDISDLAKMSENFEQKISSGSGNSSTISKKGNKLVLKTKNKGSKETETVVSKEESVVVYSSEYVEKEIKVLIKRIPLIYKLWFLLLLVIYFRKFISQLIITVYPPARGLRLFSLFVGDKKN